MTVRHFTLIALLFAAAMPLSAQRPIAIVDTTVAAIKPNPHDRFFPVGGIVPAQRDADQYVRESYGKHLAAMGEPRMGMFTDSGNVDAVRFLWLRSWAHPIAVRAMRRSDTYSLIGVELSGAGGYAPGKVVRRDSSAIDLALWSTLVSPLRDSAFWHPERRLGFDGAMWIVEAVTHKRLYYAEEFSPRKGALREFGLSLVRIAGLRPEPIY